MVLQVFLLNALVASVLVSALPFHKRVSQTVTDSTIAWVSACAAAGGSTNCTTISHQAFPALFPSKDNCEQQDVADSMIDLAKQHNNDPEMIRLALLYAQQPRNSPNDEQMPFCQTLPRNQELVGYYQCQFAGVNFSKFFGDQTGNLPLGLTSVDPPGSCPANPEGPVPDGVQLYTIVTDPGQPQAAGNLSSYTTTTQQVQAIIDIETTLINLIAPTSIAKLRRDDNDEVDIVSTFQLPELEPRRSHALKPNASFTPIIPLKSNSSRSRPGLITGKDGFSLFSLPGAPPSPHLKDSSLISYATHDSREIRARSHAKSSKPHAPPLGSSPSRPHDQGHNKAPPKPESPEAPPFVNPESEPPTLMMFKRVSRREGDAHRRSRTLGDLHMHYERYAQGEDSSGPTGDQSNSFGPVSQNQGFSPNSGSDSSASGSNETGETINQNVGPAPKTHRKPKCKHCKKD